MRKVIARRLTESKQTVPHFYLTVDCEIDALLEARREINLRAPEGVKVSVNDFVVKALATALCRVPDANAAWTEDGLLRFRQVDVSVAVAVPNGLVTPVVRQAEAKGLAEISTEMADFAARAREGKLMPRNTRAAPPACPISACSASGSSTRSSTRRRAQSWRSAPESSARS